MARKITIRLDRTRGIKKKDLKSRITEALEEALKTDIVHTPLDILVKCNMVKPTKPKPKPRPKD